MIHLFLSPLKIWNAKNSSKKARILVALIPAKSDPISLKMTAVQTVAVIRNHSAEIRVNNFDFCCEKKGGEKFPAFLKHLNPSAMKRNLFS